MDNHAKIGVILVRWQSEVAVRIMRTYIHVNMIVNPEALVHDSRLARGPRCLQVEKIVSFLIHLGRQGLPFGH